MLTDLAANLKGGIAIAKRLLRVPQTARALSENAQVVPIRRSASDPKIVAMGSALFCALPPPAEHPLRVTALDIQHPTPRLLVARHGQTAWNRDGRIQGQADPPLDRTGRRQARALARELNRSRPPGLVVASDQRRARQTAVAVARAAGCPLQFDPGLREVDAGDWEGRLRATVQAEDPGWFAGWVGGGRPAPGSLETINAAGARVLATLSVLAGDAGSPGQVVVVGHGLALQAALRLLTGETGPHLGNGEWVEVFPPASADRRPAPG